MQVKDLKVGETWTNDTGSPVELNPPGVVVQPNERVVLAENGAITVLPPVEETPKAAAKQAAPSAASKAT